MATSLAGARAGEADCPCGDPPPTFAGLLQRPRQRFSIFPAIHHHLVCPAAGNMVKRAEDESVNLGDASQKRVRRASNGDIDELSLREEFTVRALAYTGCAARRKKGAGNASLRVLASRVPWAGELQHKGFR
eukprot:4807975-Prymnesium_polylepis.2